MSTNHARLLLCGQSLWLCPDGVATAPLFGSTALSRRPPRRRAPGHVDPTNGRPRTRDRARWTAWPVDRKGTNRGVTGTDGVSKRLEEEPGANAFQKLSH